MNLAEKLAEKKRLAALAGDGVAAPHAVDVSTESKPPATIATVVTGTEVPTVAQKEDKQAAISTPNVAQAVQNVELPLVDANGKPLSGFALVKARKEAALRAQQQTNEPPPLVPVSPVAQTPTDNAQLAVDAEATFTEIKEETSVSDNEEAYEAATPETRQAYSDIKEKLDQLQAASGEDLKNEMQNLKRALMQNPNAVALMLPSDIGQMVVALRKMTGVELAAAKDEKKSKTVSKKKEVALSAEELEKAWEEL